MDGAALEPVVEASEASTTRVPPVEAKTKAIDVRKVADQRSGPRPAVKPEPKAEPKPEPKVEPKVEPKKPVEAKKKTPKQFSETKWFMVGAEFKEDDVPSDEVPVDDLRKAYKPTRELPAEVRRKFSLNYGSKDDDAGAGKDEKK